MEPTGTYISLEVLMAFAAGIEMEAIWGTFLMMEQNQRFVPDNTWKHYLGPSQLSIFALFAEEEERG